MQYYKRVRGPHKTKRQAADWEPLDYRKQEYLNKLINQLLREWVSRGSKMHRYELQDRVSIPGRLLRIVLLAPAMGLERGNKQLGSKFCCFELHSN